MPAPFSNSTEGDMFVAARCARCMHRNRESDDWCDDAAIPLLIEGTYPDFFETFSPSRINPLGVECTRYEYDPLAEG